MSLAHYFKCDGCGKAIGGRMHITLQTLAGTTTGVAVPPNHISGRSGWHTVQNFGGKLLHFHSGKCVTKFFDERIAAVKPVPSKK